MTPNRPRAWAPIASAWSRAKAINCLIMPTLLLTHTLPLRCTEHTHPKQFTEPHARRRHSHARGVLRLRAAHIVLPAAVQAMDKAASRPADTAGHRRQADGNRYRRTRARHVSARFFHSVERSGRRRVDLSHVRDDRRDDRRGPDVAQAARDAHGL